MPFLSKNYRIQQHKFAIKYQCAEIQKVSSFLIKLTFCDIYQEKLLLFLFAHKFISKRSCNKNRRISSNNNTY